MDRPKKYNIESHLKLLVGERNPHTSIEKLHECGKYIADHFKNLGLSIKEIPVEFEGTISDNILGIQPGLNSSSHYFVLGAHYDTVQGSPGADDNTSAIAALLEIARCLSDIPLIFTLIYVGFTLEEYGFIGSKHFVERFSTYGSGEISGMISLEMLGFRNPSPGSQNYPPYIDKTKYPDSGDFIAIVGNEPSQMLVTQLMEAMKTASPDLPAEVLVVPGPGDNFEEVRLSDHSPFWDNGHKAVMVTDTAFFRNPNYHQATDTLETLDVDFITEVSAGVAEYLKKTLS
jgi:aminopeptidase YwaD